MLIKAQLEQARNQAMRAREQARLDIIRLMLTAIKQYEVDTRKVADDAVVLGLFDKMLKQRRESIEQYQKAQRQELVDQEEFEITVIQSFLPAPLTDTEIEQLIVDAMHATAAQVPADIGKVIAVLRPQLAGRADISQVSAKIKQRLATAG